MCALLFCLSEARADVLAAQQQPASHACFAPTLLCILNLRRTIHRRGCATQAHAQ